ncbi:HTH-type transcriptional regulator MalT [Pseudomonas reidholzensis]|uniref:HTH-type transcriptional regulator MalT n=1 Tax=Pseudomonas reidholzensis TaxID=1785162 RepID=A0A383RU61_9PSED|nr:LuxR C-terminal-related transcriptional regulator [Pseudomonas reidholzensis]SYX90204.1 HTH-type transcriptional regulator MalT [Pseudomonas reidholzensis]
MSSNSLPPVSLDADVLFPCPASAAVQVVRAPLLSIIARSPGTLTLLTAPAGFGKTTLMAQAFAQFEAAGVAAAWINASAADNDLPRFLSRLGKLVAYLGIARPGQDAITCLSTHPQPFALFIDELENIQERSVLALVQEIAQHLPRRAHLVIATRCTPALGLSRLRVGGRLSEIDALQLRFDLADSQALFAPQLASGALSLAELQHLQAKTEGWIAALWLASIALQRAKTRPDFVAQFSGSTGTVAQYLAEVVFAEQPAEVRDFLLRVSLLKQFDRSVCQALNPHADGQRMIDHLRQQGLLIAIEAKAGHWRLHGLFAEYLRNQLASELPGAVAGLQLAASQWFADHAQPVLAIEHAVKGQQFEQALNLLEAHAEALLEQGRMRLLSRWFAAVPQALGRARPVLYMVSIWATAFTEGAHQALHRLNGIDWRSSADPRVRHHGGALYPTLLGMQDRCEEALREGMNTLEGMQAGHGFASATLLNAIAHQTLIIGHARDAQRMVDAARRLHGGESLFNRMYSETTEGLIDMLHGRLRHAAARFRLALDTLQADHNRHTHGNAWAGVLYTATLYETNQLPQAGHLINVYLPLAREVGIPDHLILIYLLKCRIALIESDIDTALQALTDLEYLGHSRLLPRAVAAAQLERAKILLIQGHAMAAQDELARAEDPAVWARECRQRLLAHDIHYLRLATLRWDIHFAEPLPALRQLDVDLKAARSSGRLHRALVLQLLRALALYRCDSAAAAHKELEEALAFAAREGYVRTVLDEGPALGRLVVEFKQLYEARSERDSLLLDYLRNLALAFGPLGHALGGKGATTTPLAEPLTRKEVVVLQLLTEGCSNLDLADRLHVSNSTVRTHLRNINAKLNTNSRTQALAVARSLGLLA